jgi:hypothetical protein
MKTPIEALTKALEAANVELDSLHQILMTRDQHRDLWEIAIQTKDMKILEPGFIRVEGDDDGAKIIESR